MICSADQYYCSVFQTLQEFNIQPGWRLGPVGMPRVHNMRFHPATWTHKSCMHIARHRRSDVGVQGEIGGKADSAKSGPLWSCEFPQKTEEVERTNNWKNWRMELREIERSCVWYICAFIFIVTLWWTYLMLAFAGNYSRELSLFARLGHENSVGGK